jgi:hypothetical protein
MADSPRLPRLYDEKEVGRLLKRATELQREDPVRANPAGGFSLEELEEIAAEAGIDPQHLRRAAAELDTGGGDVEGWEHLLGEKVTLVRQAVVPGELGPTGFERLVPAIQILASEHGQPSLLGRTLTWHSETQSKSRSLQIVVSARNGETHIRAEERLHQMAAGLFAGTTAGFGVGVGIAVGMPVGLQVLGSVLFAAAFPLGTIGLTLVAVRQIYRAVVRRRRSILTGLVEGIAAEAEAAIAEAALAESGTPLELPRG